MFEFVTDRFKYRDKPEPVRQALLTLEHKWRFFLRLYYISTKLESGASHENRMKAVREFKELRRLEYSEQMWASIGELDRKLSYAKPSMDPSSWRQLQRHMQKFKALERMILKETAEQLKPLLMVKPELIDWKSVDYLAKKIEEQLAALVAVDETLKGIVKEHSSTAQQPAYAR